MKTVFCILITVFFTINCFSQEYQITFQEYLQENDTVNLIRILKEWEEKEPQNPELFTSYFNYYFLKSMQEVIIITDEKPKDEHFVLTDSIGGVAGFLGNQTYYNEEFIQKGIAKIDEGIRLFPNRLDMRFGKTHVLGQIENWELFFNSIIETVKYSKINNNQWQWTNNEQVFDGEDFLLSAIQDYQLTLYETQNDSLLHYMKDISIEVLKIYPNHIESLSNLSIVYLLTEEHDKGLETLLKAEIINPEDLIILLNIAYVYQLKKDDEKAIIYYNKIIKFGDDDAIQFAKQQIENIKN